MKKFIIIIVVLMIGIGAGYLISNRIGENNQTHEKTQNNTQAQTDSNNEITLTEEEMYKDIINDYKEVMSEYDDDNFEVLEKYDRVNSAIVLLAKHYPEAEVAYTFYDIDKNGIKELIVGITDKTGDELNEGAIYSYNPTAKKAEIIFLQDTMERGRLSIYDNGIIYSAGSGGAALHYYEFGKIGENGYNYEEIESIEEEYIQEDSEPVYRDYKTSRVLSYKGIDEIEAKYLKNSKEIKYSKVVKL